MAEKNGISVDKPPRLFRARWFWYNFLSALKDEADAAENRESKQTINKDRY